ncbi:GIY-YIG nuclease family protein [Dysgonomonas capnocytophagoides]|uniref:GIY-YIG nuclease family protein n=1 Tax=Dysgonomonas capnocytophagoides TaxID=45254 RepID=UPI00399518DC
MGKTITTYLIDGNPQGSRYVFISNKICKMLVIPRANLSIINKRNELQSPAFYILLGENDNLKPKAYLGETENFRERIKDHDYKKGFWQKALVFISKDGAMTKADVQYLEHLAVDVASKAKRYAIDENKQVPKAPNLPEHQQDSIDEFFEDIKLLTSFIGCNIFEIIEQGNKHIFHINNRGCNAKGIYDESGFTVLKGSILANDTVPSFGWKEKREKFIIDFTSIESENIILDLDQTFSSPSTAADFCTGRSMNGWIAWRDSDGQTLDEVYRKKLE